MVWGWHSVLCIKRTTVATSKENWKSFSFRESIGADFLGLLSKKNDFG